MGLLDTILADDSAAFTDPDVFGEQVTYIKAVTGATRTINAVVNRMSPSPGKTPTGALLPMLRIHTRNDATLGITPAEWKNGDTITLAERRGGTEKKIQLLWPQENGAHDAGMVTWELR